SGNTASGLLSKVGGGILNTASGELSTVSGGAANTASGVNSTVGGGRNNTASGDSSTVGGGLENTASGAGSTVGGGFLNAVAGDYSVIPGGYGLTLDIAADRSFGFLGDNTGSNGMTINTPDVAVFGNTDLWLANNNNSASQIRFYEPNNTTGTFPPASLNFSSFRAGVQTADVNYILPTNTPAAGLVLKVSSVVGTTVSLTWAPDFTVAARDDDDDDVPTSIAPAGGDRDEVFLQLIRQQQEQLEVQQKRIERLEKALLSGGSPQEYLLEASSTEEENAPAVSD
ncbi:MAG: hypothetical protein AB7H80_17620, partial [Candidatus Kapaibacterium sp.]